MAPAGIFSTSSSGGPWASGSLRSVVSLRAGKHAGYEDLAGLDPIWKLDVKEQEGRAVRVRQDLRRQYMYLKNQVDAGDVPVDLLPGFSVGEAARAILDECGNQGSTSALDAYRRWQDACRITRTPADIASCFSGLSKVIMTAGTDYEGFLRSFQKLKSDLGSLVDDVPEGGVALELLGQIDVSARETSGCLARFDEQIVPLIQKYAVREEMVQECRTAVEGGSRSERFKTREAIIKQQNAQLDEESKDLETRIFDYAMATN